MAIPYFTVTITDLTGLVGDDVDPATGTIVTFISNVTGTGAVVTDDDTDTLIIVDPVRGIINSSGQLEDMDGNTGVRLLANGDNLNIQSLQWQVNFSQVTVRGFARTLTPWWFNAGDDGDTLDLSVVSPVPAINPSSLTLTDFARTLLQLDSFTELLGTDDWQNISDLLQHLEPGGYSETIGDGSDTEFVITHGLSTEDVSVTVWKRSTGETVEADVTRTSSSQVTVTFDTAPTFEEFRVLVQRATTVFVDTSELVVSEIGQALVTADDAEAARAALGTSISAVAIHWFLG